MSKLKAAFGAAKEKLVKNYETTGIVGLTSGLMLMGVGAISGASAMISTAPYLGGVSYLAGLIVMGGTVQMGGLFVVLPLIATTAAVETGVRLYKKGAKKPVMA